MTDRVKLVSWMLQGDVEDEVSETTTQHREYIADLMIANGVVVREKGEWEYHGQVDSVFYCSKCKLNVSGFEKRWLNFCPNCGADMTGGERNV